MSVSVVAVVLLGCGASTEASAVSEAPSSTNTAAECAGGGCAMPDVDPGTEQRSVSGAPLAACGSSPTTGFYRDGRCTTGPDDHGVHVVCAEVTAGFLSFTSSRGNDLTTPRGSFAGLHEGDRWCLCASRWAEAYEAGVAPPVVLEATHARAAELIPRAALEEHALR